MEGSGSLREDQVKNDYQSSFGSSFRREIFQNNDDFSHSLIIQKEQIESRDSQNSSQIANTIKDMNKFQLPQYSVSIRISRDGSSSCQESIKSNEITEGKKPSQSLDFVNQSTSFFKKEEIMEIQMKSNEIQKLKYEQEIYNENKQKGAENNKMIDDNVREFIQDIDLIKKLDDSTLSSQTHNLKELRQNKFEGDSFEVKQSEFHCQMADQQKKQYHFSKSIEQYETAIKLMEENKETETLQYLKSLVGLAQACHLAEITPKTIEYCEKAKQIIEKLSLTNLSQEHQKLYCSIYKYHGTALSYSGQLQEAGKSLKKALQYTLKYHTEVSLQTALVYNQIALYHSQINQIPKSIEYFQKSLKIIRKLQNTTPTDEARPLINIASSFFDLNDYQKSLNFYRQARQIFQKNLLTKHFSYGMTLYGIGMIHVYTNQLQQGFDYCLEAKNIYEQNQSNDIFQFSILVGDMGVCHRLMGNLDEAFDYLEQARKQIENMKQTNTIEYAYFLSNIADILARKNFITQAQNLLQKSRVIYDQNNHNQQGDKDLPNFYRFHIEGLLKMKKNDFEESSRLFDKAEEMFNLMQNMNKKNNPFYIEFVKSKQELRKFMRK